MGYLYLSVFCPIPTNADPDRDPGISGDLELAGRAYKWPDEALHVCASVHTQ